MSLLKVTCVTKDEADGQQSIRAVGGDGFYHTADEVIGHIGELKHHYYTEVDGKSAWLVVARGPDGHSFLTSEGENQTPDTLVAMPECRSATEDRALLSSGSLASLEADGEEGTSSLGLADVLALKTAIRLLVLDQFGRKHGRLDTMRERAIQRASGAVEGVNADEDVKRQLQNEVQSQIEALFAPQAEG